MASKTYTIGEGVETKEAFNSFINSINITDRLIVLGTLEMGSVERYSRGDKEALDYCKERLESVFPLFKRCMGV